MKTTRLLYMLLVVVLALAIAIPGCVKDQEDSTILVKPEKSLYPFLFDKGSYWIYTKVQLKADTLKTVPKDSLSQPKDSIVYVRDTINIPRDSVNVISIEKDTLYLSGNVRYYEYYRIKYHSSFNNQTYEDYLYGYVISRGLNNGGFLLLTSKKSGDKSMNATVVGVMDEMKMEEKTYKQVVKMKVVKDAYISDDYFLYYADHVGIIRKEKTVKDTVRETWNLVNYKVSLLKPE